MYHFRWGPYKASPHEFAALSYKRYFKLSYSLFVPVINSLWDNFFYFHSHFVFFAQAANDPCILMPVKKFLGHLH
jgi:hypothetical protein